MKYIQVEMVSTLCCKSMTLCVLKERERERDREREKE